MVNPNNQREAKSDLDSKEGLLLPQTLDPSSTSSTDASGSSVDATRPDSSSSSGFRISKSRCAICLNEMKKEDGKAIFTAECSHSFHFDCITSNVKHGNRICPLCRTQWKQVPLSVDDSLPVSRFSAQMGFEDDEALPQGETQIQSSGAAAHATQALEITLFPQVSAVAKPVTRSDFAVLVHLKAEGVGDDDDDRRSRAPLDLIAVLDVSGSMQGMNLELMKNAMGFVVQNLGERDRLSVIAFSSTARRLFPLRLMNETGKQAAILAVNSLVAEGGTNIAEGLRIGARVIEDRRWKNLVSGMMLLSDGQDNHTLSSRAGVRLRGDYEALLPRSCRIPIHTFGFGSDHDAELMHTISQVSSGTFSFIETENVIRDAFAQCIGGLFSVVMLDQVVEIECIHEQGLKISSVKAGSYRSRVSSDARNATIDVGDMYAEEERDFVVLLEIPRCGDESESMSLLRVRCVYKDPVTNEIIHVEARDLSIQRPMVLTGEEVVSVEVDRQLSRFLVSQAMSESRVLADGGDLNAAVELLRNRQRELSETLAARSSDSLCQSLTSELSALQERMTSRGMYHTSGRAYCFSSMSTHMGQRASTRTPTAGAHTSPMPGAAVGMQAYQTSAMARMVSRSQELGLQSPKPPSSTRSGPR